MTASGHLQTKDTSEFKSALTPKAEITDNFQESLLSAKSRHCIYNGLVRHDIDPIAARYAPNLQTE